MVLLTFFGGGEYDFSNVGVSAILGHECGIQGRNYVTLLQGSEMTADFHYNYNMDHNGVVVITSRFNPRIRRDRFPGGKYGLLFNFAIVNPLLKTIGGETEGLFFLFL